jgi:heptosyltransferase-2
MQNPLPSRLVVDLPNWVGDQVMALPTVHRLVDGNADGETTLHTRPAAGRFFQHLFPTTRVISSPMKSSPVFSARLLCHDVGRFDLGVTLRNASRAKMCLRLIARKTIGSDGQGAGFLLSESYPVNRRRHQVFDAEPMLEELGLRGVDPGWRPAMPLALVERGARALRESGVFREGAVGFAPTTVWGESKRWPAENFGELANRNRDRGLESVVVIGPGEEAAALQVQRAAGWQVPVVGADLDIADLAGVLARLSALVCNDSGPMHLAALVGTPGIALFGPTDPDRTGPLGTGHVVLRRKLDCAPCGQRRCPLGHMDCLHQLSVDMAEEALVRALG